MDSSGGCKDENKQYLKIKEIWRLRKFEDFEDLKIQNLKIWKFENFGKFEILMIWNSKKFDGGISKS